jgi:hypothetical protein
MIQLRYFRLRFTQFQRKILIPRSRVSRVYGQSGPDGQARENKKMKKSSFFYSLMAAGVLALCGTGYTASAANLPRHNAARAIATASPGEKVVLHFQGAERIFTDGSGRLEVLDSDGAIRRYRPTLFQTIDGKRKNVTFFCHIVDRDHVELKAVHPDPSAPVELAPIYALPKAS